MSNNNIYQLPELLKIKGLVHAFSTASAGNMSFKWGPSDEVKNNRSLFLENLNINPSQVVAAELIHGDNIIKVTKKEAGNGILDNNYLLKADALITRETDLFLYHIIADCLSIILYDPKTPAIGLVHVGWKNSGQHIITKAIKTMSDEFGTQTENIIVGLGPAIHSCCYAYKQAVMAQDNSWRSFLQIDNQGLTHINLVGYNLPEISIAGVKQENIHLSEYCTAHSDKFFSHYKALQNKKSEQRFSAIVGLRG